jgi:hypothetical protein
LCNQLAEGRDGPNQRFDILYGCKCCGRFILHEGTHLEKDQTYLLSAACRRWTNGERPPLISDLNIPWLLSGVPRFTVAEQMDELLQLVARKTVRIGASAAVSLEEDYPLVVVRDAQEARFLADALVARGLLDKAETMQTTDLSLTVSGWERIEQIRQSGRASSLVFVAMRFHESTDKLYSETIEPAVRDARYEPIRVDKHEHVNRIDDEIVGQIRRSRFMVADFTGQRPGVYFESGLMMGLGRNVIWMCSKAELEKVHFDVRQYNFIVWESLPDARVQLRNRILAIEGEGPRTFPNHAS